MTLDVFLEADLTHVSKSPALILPSSVTYHLANLSILEDQTPIRLSSLAGTVFPPWTLLYYIAI